MWKITRYYAVNLAGNFLCLIIYFICYYRCSGLSNSLSIKENNGTHANYENSSYDDRKLCLSKHIFDTTNIEYGQGKKK